jgi:hypothetical protein
MTRYLADYASYQGALTAADLHRAEFQVINFKTSHALTTKTVHPRIKSEIASARALGMDVGSFHWLTGDHPGTEQADHAYERLALLGLTRATMHTVDIEEQTGTDDTESAPTFAHVRDYVTRMKMLLGRPIALYTGDWWWNASGRKWNAAGLTPYLMAAPNVGYLGAYPGANSPHWNAGYGGWPTLSVMQYAVGTLIYPGGTRSTVEVSKSAIRDEAVWRTLTGGK